MKICYITDLFPPYDIGGAEKVVEAEAISMIRKGNEVVVLTTRPYKNKSSLFPEYYYDRDIKIWSFYPMTPYFTANYSSKISNFKKIFGIFLSYYNPYSALIIKKILRSEKPDIVHSHFINSLSIGALREINALDCGWVHTFHGYQFKCPRDSLLHRSGNICDGSFLPCQYHKKVFRKFMSNPDIIIAISNFVKNNLILSGYDSNKIKLIHNGFDIQKRNGIDFEKIILFVGRLVKIKGVEILLKAFSEVNNKNFVLKIVGEGEMKQQLIRDAQKLETQIEFTGRISREELNLLYKKCYMVIVPSLWHEPLTTVVIEAMSYGKPVIASNVGGMSDMIDHGKNGYLFEPGNVLLLSRCINDLMNNEMMARKMGDESRKKVKNFSMEEHTKNLLETYEELIKKRIT